MCLLSVSEIMFHKSIFSLRWRHNEWYGVSHHQPHHCLLSRLSGRRSNKTSKLRVTGFCDGNSPMTGEFPAQMASNAETVSIWWRHHVVLYHFCFDYKFAEIGWNARPILIRHRLVIDTTLIRDEAGIKPTSHRFSSDGFITVTS